MFSLVAWTITIIVERIRDKVMNRRVANLVLVVLSFVFACMCSVVLWNIWDNGRDLVNDERPTRSAQECSDQYRAMTLEERGWWDGPEDYINHCSR